MKGVPRHVLKAIIEGESSFKAYVVNQDKPGNTASGLGQITKATWATYAHGMSWDLRFNPNENIEVTATILASNMNKYHNVDIAISAYKQGSYGGKKNIPYDANYVNYIKSRSSYNGRD